jgi:predicted Zn-dependent peptidase
METAVQKRAALDEPRNIHREVLPNGLIVLSEEMAHIRSVAIGIWMKTGSRDEALEINGISHFTEHMVSAGIWTLSPAKRPFASISRCWMSIFPPPSIS